MKHIKTNPKEQSHTSLWILKILRKRSANQKFRDFCQMFAISKKNHTLGYGFKNVGQPDSPIRHTDAHHARHGSAQHAP
jgi:hypothetical protein